MRRRSELNARVIGVAAVVVVVLVGGIALIGGQLGLTTLIVGACFLIPLLLIGTVFRRENELRWKTFKRRQWDEDYKAFMSEQRERARRLVVPCPQCEQRTRPIANTGNRFRCRQCPRDFDGPQHDVINPAEYKRRYPDVSTKPYPLSP